MDFTDKGADKFHDVTRDIVESSRFRSSQGRGKVLDSFAIVLDGRIKSAPTVDPDDNPDGISGDNGAQITGIGDVDEAKDLALVLQTGALPIEFIQVDRTQVSATLGKDSLNEALRASIAGLLIVALFLLVVYRFLGVVAVFGLAIYAVLMYAVILLFNVTLTLPGFAGMILAIGVAADANIVIFERIKEEAAERKSIRAAVATGYRKGFATIVDANVVTAITALILFAVATGGVRGFAFMLLLGTGLSIITAVFATRSLLGLLAGFKWFDNPKFMGASAQKIARWQMFDAVGKRRIWFTIAGVLITLSIGSLIFKGLNLGIDFRGGTQMTFVTEEPVAIADVRSEAATFDLGDAVIQGRGNEVDGEFTEFQIKSEPLTAAEQREVVTSMETEFDASSAVAQRLGELQQGDPARRHPGDARLVPADHDLHRRALPVAVRRADPAHDRERRPDRDRDLLVQRPGGDGVDGRGVPDHHRLLDLRHDHHLRPRAREPAVDAPLDGQGDHQRLAVGDRAPVGRDDDHRAAAGDRAVPLRRRDAAGLRVRDPDRDRDQRLLDHLHRRALPGRPARA